MGTVVEDDRSLYDGILNLATSYFDTTSQFNKHHEKGFKVSRARTGRTPSRISSRAHS